MAAAVGISNLSPSIRRRRVLELVGRAGAAGTLALAGCTAQQSRLVPVQPNNTSAASPTLLETDDERDENEAGSTITPDGVAVVPLLARVSLAHQWVYEGLPHGEASATYLHVARQLTILRHDTPEGPTYHVGLETWGVDPDEISGWDDSLEFDETLYQMTDVEGGGTHYLYDNCHNVLTRRLQPPVFVDREGSFEILASPDVVEFWYILPRLSITNPGGPRGAGDCHDPRDVDELTVHELAVPGVVGGIEDCYDDRTGSTEPRTTRIRGFTAFYLFSAPWDELAAHGVVEDGEVTYECVEEVHDDRFYHAARFEFGHYIELTPLV